MPSGSTLSRLGSGVWARIQPFSLPLAVIVLWQLASLLGWLDPLFFPPPTTLAGAAAQMIQSGDLVEHTSVTLQRTALGFLIGVLLGVLCGTMMGISITVRRILEPVVSSLYSFPKLTLLPMLMLLVGVGDKPRIIVIAATAFILVSINTLDGVRGVNRHYVEMAYNYGASRSTVFRRVYLPASSPSIFTGVRLAAGRCVVVSLSMEMVGANNGLGSLIWMSWQTFSTERLYIGVFATAIIGGLLQLTFRMLENKVVPWRSRA